MTANELRIGNLIIGTNVYEGKVLTFERFNSDLDVIFFSDGSKWDSGEFIEDIKPIPLTEEWLLKFGFIRHHSDYSNGIIYIKNVPDNTEFEWGVYPNELGSGIQIKNRILLHYVHQLQNLYFALTGEELTFKSE